MRPLACLTIAALGLALFASPALAGDRGPQGKRPQHGRARHHARADVRGPRQRGSQQRGPQQRGPQARGLQMMFQRLDRNRDGVLDQREFAALARFRQQAMRGRRMQGRRMQGRRMQGRQMQGRQMQGRQMQGRRMQGRRMQGRRMQGRRTQSQDTRGRQMQRHRMRGPQARGPQARGPRRGVQTDRGRKPGAARGAPHGKPLDAQQKRRMQAQGVAILHRLRQADANGDGQLSRAEAPGLIKKYFAKLDKNDDGLLAPNEIKRAAPILRKLAQAHGGKKNAHHKARKSGKPAGKKSGKPGKKKRRDRVQDLDD